MQTKLQIIENINKALYGNVERERSSVGKDSKVTCYYINKRTGKKHEISFKEFADIKFFKKIIDKFSDTSIMQLPETAISLIMSYLEYEKEGKEKVLPSSVKYSDLVTEYVKQFRNGHSRAVSLMDGGFMTSKEDVDVITRPLSDEEQEFKKLIISVIMEELNPDIKTEKALFANILGKLRANPKLVDTPCRVMMLTSRNILNKDLYERNFMPAFAQFRAKDGSLLNKSKRQEIYARAENLHESDVEKYNAIGTTHFAKALGVREKLN